MYQVKSLDGKSLINGYEILVMGKGDSLAEVRDGNGNTKIRGKYSACEQWLRDRNMISG